MQLESFIGRKLQVALPWFDMKDFLKMLEKRQDQIDGDVFDMLSTLGDFQAFKEMMLSYKSVSFLFICLFRSLALEVCLQAY